MSFLKQNLDFLIEEPYDLEFKPLGYLTIVQETFAGLRDNH